MIGIAKGITVSLRDSRLLLDDERMDGRVPQKVIDAYRGCAFDRIWVGPKKMYLGSILHDIAQLKPPRDLELDLFIPGDDIGVYERGVRVIFANWHTQTTVYFKMAKRVLHTFEL